MAYECFFYFDLKENKVLNLNRIDEIDLALPGYSIRYYEYENNSLGVEVGNHKGITQLKGGKWNRIVRIIKNKEIDSKGIEAMLSLVGNSLPKEYHKNLVRAIQNNFIKEIKRKK